MSTFLLVGECGWLLKSVPIGGTGNPQINRRGGEGIWWGTPDSRGEIVR